MRALRPAAGLEHVGEAHEVRLDVGGRVLDRMAHAGLGGEVDHPVVPAREGRCDRVHVGEIGPDEGIIRARLGGGLLQLRQTRLFERHVVIVVDHVEAGHRVAARHERARHMEADETRASGDEDAHRQAAGTPRPRPMA